ncbi:MAG TPA: divalent-cation tolerance protein CutA [Candidatus Goldiibacteriota bacterium]|nr:divalent-cation tolerance protein CutA [Candidatus Goldiibacteriota bacterium]
MEKKCVVFVTTNGEKTSKKVSDAVLENRLAACVNRVPGIVSRYWWKGKLETSREELLIMKTKKSLVPRLIKAVKKAHPYEVPEIIALDINDGNIEYLNWVARETE